MSSKDIIIHGKNPTIFTTTTHVKKVENKHSSNTFSTKIISDDPEFPKTITQKISQELISVRNKLNMTQKEFAFLIGINENIYKKYEKVGTIIENNIYQKIKNIIGKHKNP